jgi:hypothetical protein
MDQFHGPYNGAVPLSANGGGGFVFHGEDLASMDDAHAVIAKTARGQGGMDFRLVADQKKRGDALLGLKRAQGAFDYDAAPMVATHDIHRNAHKEKQETGNSKARPGFRFQR